MSNNVCLWRKRAFDCADAGESIFLWLPGTRVVFRETAGGGTV
jgi:hypothetical protein